MSTAGSEPDHQKVRGTRERTPVLSDSPSPLSFDAAKMTITKEMPSTPRNHSDAKLLVYVLSSSSAERWAVYLIFSIRL